MPLDRIMMIKLMGMTMSQHDGECLNAISKANAILLSANMTWQEFLADIKPDQSYRVPPSQRRKQSNPFEQAGKEGQRYDDANEINSMFEDAFENANGSFREFLHSIHQWWETKDFLTAKQYDALRKAARR